MPRAQARSLARPWRSALAAGLFGLALTVTAATSTPQRVVVPTPQLPLAGYWAAADAEGARPAVLMLHGCGGPYDSQGRLSARLSEYAALMNARGWHALALDSFGPRGATELCTQATAKRTIKQQQRRRDALAALAWLAGRADVDATRLVLLGWSNGGSTVLAASNLRQDEVRAAAVRPRAAVAFYPGCGEEQRRGYRGSAQLLMLLGAADDWTPPGPCEALAREAEAPQPQVLSYAGAYHGFDGTGQVRLRRDVPNGAHPGAGVHVGGDAAARAQSQQALLDFLDEALR